MISLQVFNVPAESSAQHYPTAAPAHWEVYEDLHLSVLIARFKVHLRFCFSSLPHSIAQCPILSDEN